MRTIWVDQICLQSEKKPQKLGQTPPGPIFFIYCRQNCKNRHFSSDPDPDPDFSDPDPEVVGSGDPDPDEFEFPDPDPDPEKMTRIRHTGLHYVCIMRECRV